MSTMETPEQCHWHYSVKFIVNFEHISHMVLVFPLLNFAGAIKMEHRVKSLSSPPPQLLVPPSYQAPNRRYIPPPKILEKSSHLELYLGRGLIPCIIAQLPENQNLNLFFWYNNNMHFSINFCKQLNTILTTMKYNLQPYSWWKDIISAKVIVKASKYKKIQQKHKINATLIANSKKNNITTNDTIIPASESFSFQSTRKWSGVTIMGQRASKRASHSYQMTSPAIEVALGRIEIIFYHK